MIHLEKGRWYSANGAKYLVGGMACGGNLYVVKLEKNGTLSVLQCILSVQHDNFKPLKRIPKLPKKYDKRIEVLMEGGLCKTGYM